MRALWMLVVLGTSALFPASAHEVGAMRAKATFSARGTFTIEGVVDASHLPPGVGPGQVKEHVHVDFDGVPAHVEEEAAPSADPAMAIFHLAGRTPPGAESFGWSVDLPVGRYLLGIEEEGVEGVVWHWVEGGGPRFTVPLLHAPPPPTRAEVVRQYLELGFTHILPKGLDHILFVLGLFLLSTKPVTLLKQVTAFTVAHSITLGLTIYGVVSLSPRIVEPLIALSIVYVAVENMMITEARPWRIAVVFGFGLLHGMGFAGVLRELGLPRAEFVTALVSFNVGVEAGQLAVIGLAYLAVGLWFGKAPWYRKWVTVPASALIAAVGLYWTVERLLF